MGRYEMKAIKGMHDVRIKAAAAAAALFLCVGPMGCLTVYADPAYTEGSWMSDSRGSWYQHADGSYKKNGWEYIDGYFYYFDREGYLVRNCLIADGGHMFIADQDGRMLKNVSIDFLGSSYVIDDNGYAVTADIYYQAVINNIPKCRFVLFKQFLLFVQILRAVFTICGREYFPESVSWMAIVKSCLPGLRRGE